MIHSYYARRRFAYSQYRIMECLRTYVRTHNCLFLRMYIFTRKGSDICGVVQSIPSQEYVSIRLLIAGGP